MREFEVRTALSEPHYNAMLEVLEANGMTQAGYVRHLILRDVVQSQHVVEQMNAISERARLARKAP